VRVTQGPGLDIHDSLSQISFMKNAMTRLAVTLLSLLTAILALATALVRLVVTLITGLTAYLEAKLPRRSESSKTTQDAPAASVASVASSASSALAKSTLRVVQSSTPDVRDQVATGLVGLGFPAANVRRFVGQLTDRDLQRPVADVIRDGLAWLSRAA